MISHKKNSELDLDPPRVFGESKYFQSPLDAAILHCFETYMLALFIVTLIHFLHGFSLNSSSNLLVHTRISRPCV